MKDSKIIFCVFLTLKKTCDKNIEITFVKKKKKFLENLIIG